MPSWPLRLLLIGSGLLLAGLNALAGPRVVPCAQPQGAGYVEAGDRSKRSVVVFVHGLGGDAVGTWTRTRTFSPDVFWPCLLRQDPEFSQSNLYVYQYPAALFGNTPPLGKVATTLHEDLVADRVMEHQHISFVAHSLGGLVLSRMLLQLQESRQPRHQDELARVRQVLFFGVPGGGANLAALGSNFSDSLNLAEIADLRQLQATARRWNTTAWPFRWSCLAEGSDLSRLLLSLGRVVPADSAYALCDEGQAERHLLSGLDHFGIVKPEAEADEPYRRLYTGYALCVRPLVRDLTGLDVSATPTGQRLLGWYRELSARLQGRGPPDGLDRLVWLREKALHAAPGWSTTAYVAPRDGRLGLSPDRYAVVTGAPAFSLDFDEQMRARVAGLEVQATVPVARLQELLADRSAVSLRDDLTRQGVLAADDLALLLGAPGGRAGEQVLLLLAAQPDRIGLKGFLLLPGQDPCRRPA